MTGIRSCLQGLAVLCTVTVVGCSTSDSNPASGTESEPSQASLGESPPGSSPAGSLVEGLADPNVADEAMLAEVPNITPEIAAQLVESRPFENMLDVDMHLAESLDSAQREEVYSHLFARLDLNAASEAEILLIPGVGDRMAHEFEEYRPYLGIEQFRREIGKYVDEAEVARLEQYVRIP